MAGVAYPSRGLHQVAADCGQAINVIVGQTQCATDKGVAAVFGGNRLQAADQASHMIDCLVQSVSEVGCLDAGIVNGNDIGHVPLLGCLLYRLSGLRMAR